jgi:hypothetical protein
MAGYHMVRLVKRIEEKADELGFMLCYPTWNSNSGVDLISIKPKTDENRLPLYSRDAILFTGSIDQLEKFFDGINWARNYDEMLKVSSEKTRSKKEQEVRNKHLMQMLKDEEVTTI